PHPPPAPPPTPPAATEMYKTQTQPRPRQIPNQHQPSSNYLHDLVVANSTPHLPHLAIFIIITAPVTSLPRVFSLSRSC
ncbi:hypothetical protein CEP53_015398, partial [Fusarium sp. AF-6]